MVNRVISRLSLLSLAVMLAASSFAQTPQRGRVVRRPAPAPAATPAPAQPAPQVVDGILRQYDPATDQTLVASGEALLFDNTREGAVRPTRITMLLESSHGRMTPGAEPADPLVRVLFRYRYFVAKFDTGDPRDFAFFTGGLTLLASGELKFVGREEVAGGDVITTMRITIRASELEKVLRSMRAARSVGVLLGKDTVPLTAEHLNLIGKFLDALPHPSAGANASASPGGGAAAPAQKCELKIDRAPELRGFRLGQSVDDVLRRFPGLKLLDNRYGLGAGWNLDLAFGAYVAGSGAPVTNMSTMAMVDTRYFQGFEGVKNIKVKFTEGRLTAYRVEYDDSIKWGGVEEFRAKTAESLGLSEVWKGGTTLECEGFGVEVGRGYPAMFIEVKDVATEQSFRQREEERKRKEEQERKARFKP